MAKVISRLTIVMTRVTVVTGNATPKRLSSAERLYFISIPDMFEAFELVYPALRGEEEAEKVADLQFYGRRHKKHHFYMYLERARNKRVGASDGSLYDEGPDPKGCMHMHMHVRECMCIIIQARRLREWVLLLSHHSNGNTRRGGRPQTARCLCRWRGCLEGSDHRTSHRALEHMMLNSPP